MIHLFNAYPIETRGRFTNRRDWVRQGKWFIFQKHDQRVSHVKGLLLHDLPKTRYIKYTWEEPNTCYYLWALAKAMSDTKKTVSGYPEMIAYKPIPLIWLRADTTITRRSPIKAVFFDLITETYQCDIEWRLHRKNRFVCAFNKNYTGGLHNGLLAVIKPYDITYDKFRPKQRNRPRKVIGEQNVSGM